jgi:hypothetical protein
MFMAKTRDAHIPKSAKPAGEPPERLSGSTFLWLVRRRRRPQRKRAALRFVTGWKPRERLSAPVAE